MTAYIPSYTSPTEDDQALLEYMAPLQSELANGFSYETDQDGEYCDEDGNPTSPWEYLIDALDVEVTRSLNGDYRGARILLTFGGPNIWLDTAERELQGAWGGKRVNMHVPYEVCAEIDEAVEELAGCM